MARNLFYLNNKQWLQFGNAHLYHTSHSVDIVVPDFPDFRELNFCITILNNVWLLPAAPSRPHRPAHCEARTTHAVPHASRTRERQL